MSECQFCKTRTSLRNCKLYNTIICRFCCREKQSYEKCEGCSYRVWTPDCSEAINYGGLEASPAKRIVLKLPDKISPIPFYKKTGRVYVMRSQAEQKLVKIGYTYRNAEKRLKDINKTSYRYAYDRYYRELHLYIELEILSGGHFLEKIVHQFLKKLKRNIKGEVFSCTKGEIKILFKNYILKNLVT